MRLFHNYLSRKDEYEKSYFSIVSETVFETNVVVTEKTLKKAESIFGEWKSIYFKTS